MLLVTVRDDLAEINRALDEAEVTRNAERRRERLAQALLACARALDGFLEDDDLIATIASAQEAAGPYSDPVARTVQDAMLFEAFLNAERRLFRDLGLDSSLIDRLIVAMRAAGNAADNDRPDLQALGAGLRELRDQVGAAQETLRQEEDHRGHLRVVRRVFLVAGGAFVIGANALVGAGMTPVTGGLSVVGAAVSTGAGAVMIDRGLPEKD